jgi:hypothetical protein
MNVKLLTSRVCLLHPQEPVCVLKHFVAAHLNLLAMADRGPSPIMGSKYLRSCSQEPAPDHVLSQMNPAHVPIPSLSAHNVIALSIVFDCKCAVRAMKKKLN